MRFTPLIAALATACLASVAQGENPLEFRLENGRVSGEPDWSLFPLAINPDPTLRYRVVSRYNLSSYTFYPGGGGSAYSWRYPSFTDLRAEADGTWTVTLTSLTGGETTNSVYHLGVNLEIAPDQMVPRTLPFVPVSGQVLNSNPTFSWASGLDFVGGVAEIYGDLDSVIWTNIAPGTTSWSPGPLPDGNFSFRLHLYGPAYNYPLPITYELVSGPDMGPISVTLNYVMNAEVPFSVPEPASVLPIIMPILGLCRPRH